MKKRYLLIFIPTLLLMGCNENSTSEETSSLTSSQDRPPLPNDSNGNGDHGAPSGHGGSNSTYTGDYEAALIVTEDTTLENYSLDSTGVDENAILVKNNATLKLKNPTLSRNNSSSTGGDNSSFYGVGATLLTYEGTSYVDGGSIVGNARGAAGVFSYGKGISYVKDTTITTSLDTSGGVHVAGGGSLYGYNLNVSTMGASSAAIRSDRGSGTMVIDQGSYTSSGSGSPAIYSTADITVSEATLKAEGAEAACIEGLNTIRLFDSTLEGNMPDSSQNDVSWNVIVYQSMSGDSAIGKGTFAMVGGSLIGHNGGMFYTTNTESDFLLENVDITYSNDNDFLLQVTGNTNQRGWGSKNSNGADTNFTARKQILEGDVIYDSISNLDMYLVSSSTLTGAFKDDESYVSETGNGEANLYIDSSSTWVVSENSTLTNLYVEGNVVDALGNQVKIVDKNGNVLKSGTSSIEVIVSNYSSSVDVSNAISSPSYSDYMVEQPNYFSI